MYGFPNFVMPLVSGIIFDRIGIKFGLTLFFTITIIGLGVQMIGGYLISFKFLIVGYGLFGLGAESSFIAIYLMLVKYFNNFEFSFANGILEVLPLCAEYSGAALIPFMYQQRGFGSALSIGFTVCFANLIIMFIMFIVDIRVTKNDSLLL